MLEALKGIYQEMSKLVFFLIAVTVCVSYLTGKMETKEFMVLAGMAFTFYFSFNKGNSSEPVGK